MIPVATTRISVMAPQPSNIDPWSDGYDDPQSDPARTRKARDVRATISAGAARGSSGGAGEQQSATFSMVCDPTDLTYRDEVLDQITGQTYVVEWVVETPGIAGLGHMQVGLSQNRGGTT